MDLSVTTDFEEDTGSPERWLQAISEAGFSHIHWCHHWSTDFQYSQAEIDQIGAWLRELGLSLLDLHASAGREKRWGSPTEYERQAGVDLVLNRITMAEQLGGRAVVLHAPARDSLESQLRSLDVLQGSARERGIHIALENLGANDLARLDDLLSRTDPSSVGLCYDSGHANICGDNLTILERHLDRVVALHLHDNDGAADQHRIPGDGTVSWDDLCGLLPASSYRGCVSLEVSRKTYPDRSIGEFLDDTRVAGARITGMLAEGRTTG